MERSAIDVVTEEIKAMEVSDGKKLAGFADGDGGVEAKTATTVTVAVATESDSKNKKNKKKNRRIHVCRNKRPLFFNCNLAKLVTEVRAFNAKVDELPALVTQAVKQGIEAQVNLLVTEVRVFNAKIDELPALVTQAVKQGIEVVTEAVKQGIEDALKKQPSGDIKDMTPTGTPTKPFDRAVGGAIQATTPTRIPAVPNEATTSTGTPLAFKSAICTLVLE